MIGIGGSRNAFEASRSCSVVKPVVLLEELK